MVSCITSKALRHIPKRSPALMGISIFGYTFGENPDQVDSNIETVKLMQQQADSQSQNETGWDRVKAAFQTDDFGALSPEIENSLNAGYAGLFVGGLIGATLSSKEAYQTFIENNKATVFENHFQAKKALQNKVTLAMANGGFKVGWRLGLFSSSFVLFTSLVSSYRNKTSVWEYSAGGALAGTLYKFTMGPKGMAAGGLAGLTLGTVAGVISVGLMKLTGTTSEEIRFYRRGWKKARTSELGTEEAPHLTVKEKAKNV